MSEPSIDRLLQHSRWVNSLAGSLARDPGLADDLVQETWLQVLRRGPTDDRSPRGWLATILRRQLRQMRRGDERRVAREHSRARELADVSTSEVVERAELHRSLVQAVLDLREPFRTTVLLRYLEERSPEEIAGLTAVPVATVHSRLGRGLAALRARLGKKHDERAGLLGLLRWLPVGQPRRLVELLRQEALPLAALGAVLVLAGMLASSALSGGAREVIVLLDRSYSMGYADTWSRAQRGAAQALDSATPADRISVVQLADIAEVVVR
ncbi:MAG: sigma-70 family RNA polymerase sigma factor, partial [Planctomycetota bacterium]